MNDDLKEVLTKIIDKEIYIFTKGINKILNTYGLTSDEIKIVIKDLK